MKMKKRIKHPFFFMILLILLIVICAVTYAYRTDHQGKMNVFTSGEVKISLTEPKYNQSENVLARKVLAPRQSVVKDPKITNTGKSDAFVFLEVYLPRTNRILIDTNGQKLPVEYRDAFTFKTNTEWVPVEDEFLMDASGKHYHRFVYAYATGTSLTGKMNTLKSKVSTPTLFSGDTITFRNFIEVKEKNAFDIPVIAYAVQTTDLVLTDKAGDTGRTAPAEVWKLLKAQIKAEKGGR